MSGFQHSCATRRRAHMHPETGRRTFDSYLRADGRRASYMNLLGRIPLNLPRRDPFRPQEVPNSRPCRSKLAWSAVSHDFAVSTSPPSPNITGRQDAGCIREILYKSEKKVYPRMRSRPSTPGMQLSTHNCQ